jgi:hypothetical protein
MNPTSVSGTIVQEITIKGPAERIFEALTNPDERMKWWGAEGKFQTTQMESDLRPGGKWVMRGIGMGEKPFTVAGEYHKIERPRSLVFTLLPWLRSLCALLLWISPRASISLRSAMYIPPSRNVPTLPVRDGWIAFPRSGQGQEERSPTYGFRHRVYKNYDPRAKIIKRECDQLLETLEVSDPLLDIARRLEQIAFA